MSYPQFTEGTKRLLRVHPALAPSLTRELGASFTAAQTVVCNRLAALGYPLSRMMEELRAGHLPYFREGSDQDRKDGGKKAAYRFAGFAPSHREEWDAQAGARAAGPAFEAWQAQFLMRFTFEVAEQAAQRVFPPQTPSTEGAALARRQLAEALRAARALRDEILCGNLLLVAQIAIRRARYSGSLSLDELFTAGIDGLLIAVNRYDPSVAHFSTYATPWISMAIDRFAANHRNVIRIPIGLQEKARRHIGGASELIPQVQSLEEPLPGGADGDLRLEDVVADTSARLPSETSEGADIAILLEEGMRELGGMKQLVVALRSDVGDAAALGAKFFREEMALSLSRGRATAAAAAQTLDEPARIRLLAPAVPASDPFDVTQGARLELTPMSVAV